MKILDLFPTPVLITKINLGGEEENEYLKSFSDSNNREEKYDYILKDEKLKKLRKSLEDTGNFFAQKYLSVLPPLVFQQSWVNNKTYDTYFHRHKNSVVSGVYYFGEEYSKVLVFDKPEVSNGYMLEPEYDDSLFESNPYTRTQTAVKPEKNTVVLFPSYVPHGVIPMNEDNPPGLHQSLAFNMIPKNTLGERHRLNQFNYIVEERDLKNA